MPFSVQIVASAQEELKEIDVFYRLQIAAAIESNLVHQPTLESRNRKMLAEAAPSFECEPPIWELRVGDFRVFYDDESAAAVYVRAIREKPPRATTQEIL